ncbi:hypothetical protein JW930_02750 [Candidatus Woesearchaeota archaeon]|nr:hypothetical protein [Candidatus Woesearchaeota archaeon]
MNRKAMTLLTKSMFAIFMVVFVFLVVFLLIQNRVQRLESGQQFDYYLKGNRFLTALISNPNCLSLGQLQDRKSDTIQSALDVNKLNLNDGKNQDLWCMENYDFIYSIEVEDSSRNMWRIGLLNQDPRWSERKIKITLPCIVRFDNGIVHAGTVSLIEHVGQIPRFYGLIKESCVTKESRTVKINTGYDLKYEDDTNTFFMGDDYFFPYFSCRVEPFEISKGTHLVYLSYKDGSLKIKV